MMIITHNGAPLAIVSDREEAVDFAVSTGTPDELQLWARNSSGEFADVSFFEEEEV